MTFEPYLPPLSPSLFPALFSVLLSMGIALVVFLFIYEVSTPRKRKSLVLESVIASVASLALGFGVLFLFLWGGLWV
jgi:uncharacterized membrane protein YjfL (UPF0719 family)